MSISELKEGLTSFMALDDLSLTIYLRLKSEEIRLADVNNDILPEMRNLFFEKINYLIIDKPDLSLRNLSEADDRKNVLYEYDFEEELGLFTQINSLEENLEPDRFNFNENGIDDIDGLIIRIGNSSNSITLYSKSYPINVIKRDAIFKLVPSETRFEKFDKPLLKVNGSFEIIKYESKYYILKYEMLERKYGFEKLIRSTAESSITKISDIGLVQNLSKLQENLETLSFARKFVKAAKYSPVINMGLTASRILDFVKTHHSLAGKFKFNEAEDQIILDTTKSCNLFLKLLDDDFLNSLLTGIEYDSSVKDQIGQ